MAKTKKKLKKKVETELTPEERHQKRLKMSVKKFAKKAGLTICKFIEGFLEKGGIKTVEDLLHTSINHEDLLTYKRLLNFRDKLRELGMENAGYDYEFFVTSS